MNVKLKESDNQQTKNIEKVDKVIEDINKRSVLLNYTSRKFTAKDLHARFVMKYLTPGTC